MKFGLFLTILWLAIAAMPVPVCAGGIIAADSAVSEQVG